MTSTEAKGANGVADDFPVLHRDTADKETFNAAVWDPVFNHRRATERVPRAVVKARTAAHVRQAVELAAKENCRVSVRSGGHSWAGWSVRDDAVLIDLVTLPSGKRYDGSVDDGISYDPTTHVVSCPPSTTGQILNGVLKKKGRMFAGGHCPDVGLGGFLLQGGMGWNCKNWGWACEYIVGADVVTADARELHCSAEENSDLFWAVRGSGPGFPAVITRFHLKTVPLFELYQSLYIYPISEYRTVQKWVVDLCPTADPDTEIVTVGQYLSGTDDHVILANFLSFKPSRAEAEAALQPLHDSRPPGAKIEVFSQTTSLELQYCDQKAANPENHRFCSENAYVGNDEDVVGILERAYTTLPTRQSFAIYYAMNPTSRRPLPDMALSMHSDHYFALYTCWKDGAQDSDNVAWVLDVMKTVERHAVGSYLGDADFQHRRTKFWTDEASEKLREIRRKWDPTGRICGYLDDGDKSGIQGLKNVFEWATTGST